MPTQNKEVLRIRALKPPAPQWLYRLDDHIRTPGTKTKPPKYEPYVKNKPAPASR